MYKLTNTNSILRLSDNATIPKDEANTDYQAYLEWAKTNKPQPVDKPTLNEIVNAFESAIETYLDSKAMDKGYDNILSACSYASAPNPFQNEGIQFVKWRGNVWVYCYGELDKVKTGKREMPTVEQIISELPAL